MKNGPFLGRSSRQASKPATRRCWKCAASWTRCPICCARAANGEPCRTTSHPGPPGSTTTRHGADEELGRRSTPLCMTASAWPMAARPSPRRRSSREGACRTSTPSPRARPRRAARAATAARRCPAASAKPLWTRKATCSRRACTQPTSTNAWAAVRRPRFAKPLPGTRDAPEIGTAGALELLNSLSVGETSHSPCRCP